MGDKEANLAQLQQRMQNMADDTDLVVLPEQFSTGILTSEPERAAQLAERNTGDTMRLLHKLAQEYRVAICGAFLPARRRSSITALSLSSPTARRCSTTRNTIW